MTPPSAVRVPAGTFVVGLDGSEVGWLALDWAIEQAVLEGRRITLVHSVPPVTLGLRADLTTGHRDYLDLVAGAASAGERLLDRAVDHTRERAGGTEVFRVQTRADPRDVLLDLAREAALVVVGSRGRGPVASLLLGSVSVTLAQHAACPVVVVHDTGAVESDGILVGVDATPAGAGALEFAYRLASFRRVPLTVLHAYWDVSIAADGVSQHDELRSQQVVLAESLAGLRERYPDVEVHRRLAHGSADRVLREASALFALVVIASGSGSPLDRALDGLLHASVATELVEHVRCSIAVVPATALSPAARKRRYVA